MFPFHAEDGMGSREGQGLGLSLRCGLLFAVMFIIAYSERSVLGAEEGAEWDSRV